MAVQWLGHRAYTAEGRCSIPGQETKIRTSLGVAKKKVEVKFFQHQIHCFQVSNSVEFSSFTICSCPSICFQNIFIPKGDELVEQSLLAPHPSVTTYAQRSSRSGPVKTLLRVFSPFKTLPQLLTSLSVKVKSLSGRRGSVQSGSVPSPAPPPFSLAAASLWFLHDLSHEPASGPLNMRLPAPHLHFLQRSMRLFLNPSGLYSSVTFPRQLFLVPLLKILPPFTALSIFIARITL